MSSTLNYLNLRNSLIDDDRSLRRNIRTLSLPEIKADKIVRDIRSAEASTIWKEQHESITHPFPGMEFLTGNFSYCCWVEALVSMLRRTRNNCQDQTVCNSEKGATDGRCVLILPITEA